MSTLYRAGLLVVLSICLASPLYAQHSVRVKVTDSETREPLIRANVVLQGTTIGGATDSDGLVTVSPIPEGQHALQITFLGFQSQEISVTVPAADPDVIIDVRLIEETLHTDEIAVTATRSRRSIDNSPTRLEVIGGEEIEEKIIMDPSSISMLLTESPGIVVQTTSAVSGSSTFSIQGLDGRYTQLLRDGFPLYGGLDGGLSILQIPPLDLAQVEIIKGPASTLYGSDAIAGLVNLVTKTPPTSPERSILLNATSAGGYDLAGYASGRNARHGYTLLVSGNAQNAYDAEGDHFTNLPYARRLTVTPTYYHYGERRLVIGLSGTVERREGGDIDAITGDSGGYVERNSSERLTGMVKYNLLVSGPIDAEIRSSASFFRRSLEIPGFTFGGSQFSTLTEILFTPNALDDMVIGVDLRTDRFAQSDGDSPTLDYSHQSVGVFSQSTWDVSEVLDLETGLRADAHSAYGIHVLPRVNMLVRPYYLTSIRFGGGLGYAVPTPFIEEAESHGYRGVRPINPDSVHAEHSIGANADVSHGVRLGPIYANLNQAFYVTRISNALLPVFDSGTITFANADTPTISRSAETTARFSYDHFTLFLGYVYLNATHDVNSEQQQIPLTATHRTYSVLMWEEHDRGRIGLEAYYTGKQLLPDGTESRGYWILGALAQWQFGPFTVFANAENILDSRQTRYAPLVISPRDNPTFAPVWAPVDGFVLNAGVMIDL